MPLISSPCASRRYEWPTCRQSACSEKRLSAHSYLYVFSMRVVVVVIGWRHHYRVRCGSCSCACSESTVRRQMVNRRDAQLHTRSISDPAAHALPLPPHGNITLHIYIYIYTHIHIHIYTPRYVYTYYIYLSIYQSIYRIIMSFCSGLGLLGMDVPSVGSRQPVSRSQAIAIVNHNMITYNMRSSNII